MMRTMLRQTFMYLSSKKWNKSLVKQFNKIMLNYPLNINDDSIPDGKSFNMCFNLIEFFLISKRFYRCQLSCERHIFGGVG